jgi:hypothetical protein
MLNLLGAGAYVDIGSYNDLAALAGAPAGAVTWRVAPITGGYFYYNYNYFLYLKIFFFFFLRYSLQNEATSLYASADNAGASAVVANRNTPSGWETFSFVSKPGGTYAILVCLFYIILFYSILFYFILFYFI